jgi:hypothetical protein
MMQAYIEGKREASTLGSLVTLLAFLFGILGIAIAYGTAFGWIPLGDRAQILRSDVNTIEIIVTVISLVYAACCFRTAYGLYIRAGMDGTGTRRAIEGIMNGLRWRAVAEPVLCRGEWQEALVADCEELGMTLAAGLEAGVF